MNGNPICQCARVFMRVDCAIKKTKFTPSLKSRFDFACPIIIVISGQTSWSDEVARTILRAKVGSYHASSLLVASRPLTPGILSQGIGLEGFCSVFAGLWGTGTGSTTLTENVYTIAGTKMGSRRAVELGAIILIVISLLGKVGGFIASIPEVIVAALLCFMWAMLTALGLSNLRYSEAGSSRNIIVVGLALFFSLSMPCNRSSVILRCIKKRFVCK